MQTAGVNGPISSLMEQHKVSSHNILPLSSRLPEGHTAALGAATVEGCRSPLEHAVRCAARILA